MCSYGNVIARQTAQTSHFGRVSRIDDVSLAGASHQLERRKTASNSCLSCSQHSCNPQDATTYFTVDSTLITIPNVELNARLDELRRLKDSGLISDSEYSALVELAHTQSQIAIPVSSTEKSSSEARLNKKQKLILAGVISGVLIFFFAIRFTASGDPKDSKEYKELLFRKEELVGKKADLQKELNGLRDVTTEITDYREKVERWRAALEEVKSRGLS